MSLTVSEDIVEQIRQIAQELGYVDDEGRGIPTPVASLLLPLAVEGYQNGQIEIYQRVVTLTRTALRWKAGEGRATGEPAQEDRESEKS